MDHPVRFEPQRKIFSDERSDPFGAYHDLYANGSTILRTGGVFAATVTAYHFPRLLLFDRQVAGAVHQRDATRVRRDGFDHYHLQVLRSGRMAGGAWGNEGTLSPGDAILFDTTRPQRTLVTAADYVTVVLPRDIVEATLPDARRLHGIVLPHAVSNALHATVMALARHAASLEGSLAAESGHIVVDLLARIAGPVRDRPAGADHDAGGLELKRLQAEAFIESHLGRPDLDVSAVAAASGLSRSALYRVFAPVGGVEREILRRRLARLRVAILRPGETRSLASLAEATGFASESHCSRAFKATYGSAPTHLRREVRRVHETGDGVLDADRMREWFGELRPSGTRPYPPR